MNRNSSVKARIAISLLPKLNSCIYLPLIERCGGLEGFFLESDQALNQLYRELNIPTDTFNRKTAIQNSEAEIEQLDKRDTNLHNRRRVLSGIAPAMCRCSPGLFL